MQASLSAGNLRATLIEHRRRYPDVEVCLSDSASEHLFANLAGVSVDIAFGIEDSAKWEDRSLPVWSEWVVVALPDGHLLNGKETIYWDDLRQEVLLVQRRGPNVASQALQNILRTTLPSNGNNGYTGRPNRDNCKHRGPQRGHNDLRVCASWIAGGFFET